MFETLDGDCRVNCHVVSFNCEDIGINPQSDEDKCTEYCFAKKDSALERGSECAQAYEDMMSCLGESVEACEDWYNWALRSPASACAEESAHFDQICGVLK